MGDFMGAFERTEMNNAIAENGKLKRELKAIQEAVVEWYNEKSDAADDVLAEMAIDIQYGDAITRNKTRRSK